MNTDFFGGGGKLGQMKGNENFLKKRTRRNDYAVLSASCLNEGQLSEGKK